MKISVCGIPHEIVMREPNARDDGSYGKYDGKMGKIFIDATMPESVKESTILHEWLHGVYEQNGIQHDEHHVSVMAVELYRQGFRIKFMQEDGE